MKSPINIVFLTPGFPADEKDTTVIPSLQLYFMDLKKFHPEVRFRIIAFHYPFRSGTYEWNGIPVYAAGGRGRKILKIYTWFKILALLVKLKIRKQADLIHSFWLNDTTLVGLIFRSMTGVPLIATAMGQDVLPGNRYLNLARKFHFNLVPISLFQSRFLRRPGNINIMNFIPFGIEPSFYNLDHQQRTTDVLGVGSINPIKDWPCFINVIKIVVRHLPELRCRIVGDGPESKRLILLISENGLEGNITLTGRLPYKEVQQEMLTSHIFLHTASFEGQGLVITEALAAGMFVVARPAGMAADLVSNKLRTGRNAEELAARVLDLLGPEQKDFKGELPFTVNDTTREYLKHYEETVKNTKP